MTFGPDFYDCNRRWLPRPEARGREGGGENAKYSSSRSLPPLIPVLHGNGTAIREAPDRIFLSSSPPLPYTPSIVYALLASVEITILDGLRRRRKELYCMYEPGREREGGGPSPFRSDPPLLKQKTVLPSEEKRIDTGLGREGDPRADDKEDFFLLLLSLLPLSIVSYLPPSLDSDETDNLIFGSHERGERQRRTRRRDGGGRQKSNRGGSGVGCGAAVTMLATSQRNPGRPFPNRRSMTGSSPSSFPPSSLSMGASVSCQSAQSRSPPPLHSLSVSLYLFSPRFGAAVVICFCENDD